MRAAKQVGGRECAERTGQRRCDGVSIETIASVWMEHYALLQHVCGWSKAMYKDEGWIGTRCELSREKSFGEAGASPRPRVLAF